MRSEQAQVARWLALLKGVWLAFGGVVEKVGVLDRLITPIIEKAKSNDALVASLTSSIVATNIVTADRYIGHRAAGTDV
jgi:Na+/H+ antiporter NhaC